MWHWLLGAGQTLEKYEASPIASFEVQFFDKEGKPVGQRMATRVRFAEGAAYSCTAREGWLHQQEYEVGMRMKERFRDALYAQAKAAVEVPQDLS